VKILVNITNLSWKESVEIIELRAFEYLSSLFVKTNFQNVM